MRSSSLACQVLALTLSVAGCASAPAPLPPLKRQALEAETQGARRFEQGYFEVATAQFQEAQRLNQSLDDQAGVARNLAHQVRAALAAGLPAAAQATLNTLVQRQPSAQDPDIETGLLQAQVALALNDLPTAQAVLKGLSARCQACAQAAPLAVLHARVALGQSQAQVAEQWLMQALGPLARQSEPRELANAWRLMAHAQALQQRPAEALASAHEALRLDRALGLPEKIAADWLLIARVQTPLDRAQARSAYARARAVASAAQLHALVAQIDQSLKELP